MANSPTNTDIIADVSLNGKYTSNCAIKIVVKNILTADWIKGESFK